MLITCDMGNTSTKFALFDGENQLSFTFVETTDMDYKSFIKSFLYKANIRESQVDDSIIACVVPKLKKSIISALKAVVGKDPIVISNDFHPGIGIDNEITDNIGADLLVMSAYSFQKIKKELVVVSLGTATVLTHVSKFGIFKHCIIAPGFATLASTLYKNAAGLPQFEATKHNTFLANNTIDAMSIGVYDGFIGMVRYLLAGMRGQIGTNPIVIGCGGAGKDIAQYITDFSAYNADLVTIGLNFIYNKYIKK